MELPNKPSNYTVEEIVQKVNCAACGNDLYEVRVEEENYRIFLDRSGNVRGTGAGALPIEDPAALPRQLEEDGSIFLCGSCNKVDTYERQGGTIFGIDNHNNHYGAFYMGDTIIFDHYIPDNNFDRSNFSEAFESIALNEDDVRLNDGTKMVEYKEEDKKDVINKVENGENPFNHTVIVSGRMVFIPEDKS